ncbi:Uu.00g013980.m01.CDS01 [Anthostomella pinea]|uniref:Uu.00g013980.m01.CDS01 n=1 Tax=Anthostomella pinea TaxID=933095 RepID=A0AAI8YQ78_9PEZI|nr:Uu.00g013980.m01.CDS01 [Anthostomella pinea]
MGDCRDYVESTPSCLPAGATLERQILFSRSDTVPSRHPQGGKTGEDHVLGLCRIWNCKEAGETSKAG